MPSGLIGLPPGIVQRGLLVLLQTLMPYLADRVGGTAEAPLHSAPWASHHSSDHPTTTPTSHVASTGACFYSLLAQSLLNVLVVSMALHVYHAQARHASFCLALPDSSRGCA